MDINKDAFKKLYEQNGFTTYSISDSIGVSQATVSAWMTRKSIPAKYIKSLADLFQVELEEFENLIILNTIIPTTEEEERIMIEVFNENFEKYYNSYEISNPKEAASYREGFIALKSGANNAEFFVILKSKALEPHFNYGDYIGVKTIDLDDIKENAIEYGRFYMISLNDHSFIYRRITQNNKDNNLVLKSENESLEDIIVAKEDIKILFIIVAKLSLNII